MMFENPHAHWKVYKDGTHRSCHPEQTLKRIRPFLPAMGITRIANITGLDTIGVPVYMVTRPNSRSLAVSQGKGYTHAAAKVSGVMEAIEIYHAERLDINTRVGDLNDMGISHDVVDIKELGRNKRKSFDEYTRIPWVEAQDIATKRPVWVPYEAVHTDYTLPLCFDGGYFSSDTNGLASGNSIVEAIVHGLSEVIERDALTLWALRDKPFKASRRLAISTIDDVRSRDVISLFKAAGVGLGIWDISTEFGIPTFICKVVEANASDTRIRPAFGSGCHPNKSIALLRALTEAAQSRLTFIAGSRDDQPLKNYLNYQNGKSAEWIDEVLSGEGSRSYGQAPNFEGEILEDDLQFMLSRLAVSGLSQVLFVDLTKVQFQIPVVKVIVPGLEGHINPANRIPGKRAIAVMEDRNVYA